MENTYTDLYQKLSRLQWLLQRYRMVSHAENGPFADTSRGQGRVLAMLKLQPEISTKDLSYLLGIRIPSLNELLGKMEKGGYIERKPSEADKRVMIIHLTDKGRETQQEKNDYSDIFDCLSEEEQIAFGEYLDRIIAALEAQLGDGRDGDEMEGWMNNMRSHMGDEQFEKLMRMRGGFRPHGHPGHERGDWGGFHDERDGHGRPWPDERGPAPEHMPGGERFRPDYDGPRPDRCGGHGHGRRGHAQDGPRSDREE